MAATIINFSVSFSMIRQNWICVVFSDEWKRKALKSCTGNNSDMLTRPKPNDLFYDLLNYRRSNVMRYSPSCRGLSRESDVGLYALARLLDVIITVSRWNGPMDAHRSAFTALTSAPSRAAEQWPCLHLSPSSWQRELSAWSSGGGVTTAKHSGIVRVDNVPLKKLKNQTCILYVLM